MVHVTRPPARKGSCYYQNICKLQAQWKHIPFRDSGFCSLRQWSRHLHLIIGMF